MKNYSDNEFLDKVCAFHGKESFIRFINLVTNCPYKEKKPCIDSCGECFYKYIREINNIDLNKFETEFNKDNYTKNDIRKLLNYTFKLKEENMILKDIYEK